MYDILIISLVLNLDILIRYYINFFVYICKMSVNNEE